MRVAVTVELNGVSVPLVLDDDAVRTIAAALPEREREEPASPYMTIPEAAEFLRCSRQRVDDLLSQGPLQRVKDGARTLIRRSDLAAYLDGGKRSGR
jgi:excisionase family DNA binding protein